MLHEAHRQRDAIVVLFLRFIGIDSFFVGILGQEWVHGIWYLPRIRRFIEEVLHDKGRYAKGDKVSACERVGEAAGAVDAHHSCWAGTEVYTALVGEVSSRIAISCDCDFLMPGSSACWSSSYHQLL